MKHISKVIAERMSRGAEIFLTSYFQVHFGVRVHITADVEAKTVKVGCPLHPDTEYMLVKDVDFATASSLLTSLADAELEDGTLELVGITATDKVHQGMPRIFGIPSKEIRA